MSDAEFQQEPEFNSLHDCLIATLQSDVTSSYLEQLESSVLGTLTARSHGHLIIDATPVRFIDVTDFARLRSLLEKARLVGAKSVIVGLRPRVVAALIDQDAPTDGILAARSLAHALEVLGVDRSE